MVLPCPKWFWPVYYYLEPKEGCLGGGVAQGPERYFWVISGYEECLWTTLTLSLPLTHHRVFSSTLGLKKKKRQNKLAFILPLPQTTKRTIKGFLKKWFRRSSVCLQCWRLGFDPWVGKIPLEKDIATHSSILACKIPWTEEPGRLQSMGLQRVGNDWATWLYFHKPSTKRKQQKPNLAHSKTDGWMATDLAVMRKLKPQPAAGKDKKQPGCASEIQAWGCQVLFKVHVKTGWKTGESVKVKNGVSCSSCSPVLWPHGL